MKRIIVCLLVMLLFVGCTQQAAEEEVETEEDTTTETQQTEVKPESTILTDEVIDTLNAQLTPGVKSTNIVPNHLTLKYGGRAVFGIGLQNIQNAEDDFLVTAEFDKAYDKYMNTIDTSEDMMNSWVKTNLEMFTLASNEKKIVSIVIDVEEINDGVKPPAGTYQFRVETLYKRGGFHPNKEYIGRRTVSIRVEK